MLSLGRAEGAGRGGLEQQNSSALLYILYIKAQDVDHSLRQRLPDGFNMFDVFNRMHTLPDMVDSYLTLVFIG